MIKVYLWLILSKSITFLHSNIIGYSLVGDKVTVWESNNFMHNSFESIYHRKSGKWYWREASKHNFVGQLSNLITLQLEW